MKKIILAAIMSLNLFATSGDYFEEDNNKEVSESNKIKEQNKEESEMKEQMNKQIQEQMKELQKQLQQQLGQHKN